MDGYAKGPPARDADGGAPGYVPACGDGDEMEMVDRVGFSSYTAVSLSKASRFDVAGSLSPFNNAYFALTSQCWTPLNLRHELD